MTAFSVELATEDENKVSLIGIVVPNSEVEDAVLEALYRTGLYESAIARCRASIASAKPDSIDFAKANAWLIATLAERDSLNAPTIQTAIEAAEIAYNSIISDPKNQKYRLWNQFAFESVRYRLAKRSVGAYLSAPTNTLRRDNALETIRGIVDQLEQLRPLVQAQIGLALRQSDRESAKFAGELATLRNRLLLLEIDSYLLRSECYPIRSNECIEAGALSLAAIEKMKEQVDPSWNGKSFLDLASFQSLVAINRFSDAIRGLEKWIPTIGGLEVRNRALALAAKASLLLDDYQNARRFLGMGSTDSTKASPDLALANLELQIALWKNRVDSSSPESVSPNENQQHIESILRSRDEIAQRFGDYWRQRAEALVVSSSNAKTEAAHSASIPGNLDLLKVAIRQSLAAGHIGEAIEQLEQAEAASLAVNDLQQAFSFAKTILGLIRKELGSDQPSASFARFAIDRIAKTALKYSDQDGAVQIHQIAVEEQAKLASAAFGGANAANESGRYRQILHEHVDVWSDDATSDANRQRLQALYLGTGDLALLVELWRSTINALLLNSETAAASPSEDRQEKRIAASQYLISTMLLSSIVNKVNFSQSDESLAMMHSTYVSTYELLSGDYDWWTIDGGIRRSDGRALDWGIVKPENADSDIPKLILKILVSAKQNSASDIGSELQTFLEWYQEDRVGRVGYLAALNVAVSNILRLRSTDHWEQSDRNDWAALLGKLHSAMPTTLETELDTLHSSVKSELSEIASLVEARALAMKGEAVQAKSRLERLRQSDPRNPLWTLELARVYELSGKEALNDAIQRYRQLAAGSQIGTETWYEVRLSSARCLRKMEKIKEADEVLALVQAMVVDMPTKWKQRIK
ncbi:MAG: hypothetical protein SGI77_20110 [Pirellulaceae bacterium]|nr:hypothetical protein [Pirellulaceae bacterium]